MLASCQAELAAVLPWLQLEQFDRRAVNRRLRQYAAGDDAGRPVAVIQALLRVVGAAGTLMMPTQTWKNLDPASGVHQEEGIPEAWWPIVREHLPAYDPAITPSIGMG